MEENHRKLVIFWSPFCQYFLKIFSVVYRTKKRLLTIVFKFGTFLQKIENIHETCDYKKKQKYVILSQVWRSHWFKRIFFLTKIVFYGLKCLYFYKLSLILI